jgi:hypothetical protein
MANEVKGLNIKIGANTADFDKSLKDTIGKLKEWSASAQAALRSFSSFSFSGGGIADPFKTIGNSLSALAKQASSMATSAGMPELGAVFAGYGVAAQAAGDAFSFLANSWKDANREARQLGLSVNQLTGLKIAGRGIDPDALNAGLRKFQAELGEAATGSAEQQKRFQDLGLSWKELAALPLNEAMAKVADKVHDAGSQAEKAAIAYNLFGRNYAELLPLLEKGNAAFAQGQEQADNTIGFQKITRFSGNLSKIIKDDAASLLDRIGNAITPDSWKAQEKAQQANEKRDNAAGIAAMVESDRLKTLAKLYEKIGQEGIKADPFAAMEVSARAAVSNAQELVQVLNRIQSQRDRIAALKRDEEDKKDKDKFFNQANPTAAMWKELNRIDQLRRHGVLNPNDADKLIAQLRRKINDNDNPERGLAPLALKDSAEAIRLAAEQMKNLDAKQDKEKDENFKKNLTNLLNQCLAALKGVPE